MFDNKQKSCVKRIHLVIDDGLYNRKAFYKLKIVFYSSSDCASKLMGDSKCSFKDYRNMGQYNNLSCYHRLNEFRNLVPRTEKPKT